MCRALILLLSILSILSGCATEPLTGDREGQPEIAAAPPAQTFIRVRDLPEGDQADVVLSDRLAGVKNANVLRWTFPAPYALVWEACKAAARDLEKNGGRPIITLDEGGGKILSGHLRAEAGASLPSPGRWLDQFQIEATFLSKEQTKVSVTRRVVKYSGGTKNPWIGQWSNGRIEWWLLTYIRDILEGKRTPKVVPAERPAPVAVPQPSPPPALVVAIPLRDAIEVEIIKTPFLEFVKSGDIRALPTAKGRIIGRGEKGSKVEKVSKIKGWYRIQLPSGELGWIPRKMARELE